MCRCSRSGLSHGQASGSTCLPLLGFGDSSASARLRTGLRNGSKMSFLARLSQVVTVHRENAGGLQAWFPTELVSTASPSLSGMLSLWCLHRQTDLSWPKNTVNILGSVLCSLMVQDANTPKPTSYMQSLAPKEILCLHHMKSWICIQSQREEHREWKDIGGWQEKEPRHAGLGTSCRQSCLGVKPTGAQAGFEAG